MANNVKITGTRATAAGNRKATTKAQALLTKVAPKGKITNGADAYLFDMRGPALMAELIAEVTRLRQTVTWMLASKGAYLFHEDQCPWQYEADDTCNCRVSHARALAARGEKEGE